MRALRTVIGVLGLLVALPVLLAGAGLWTVQSHRDPDGAFSAALDEVSVDGHAVVVTDVDAVLRRDAAFARGGQTTLRVTARTAAGPVFVGLAPAGAVERYLGEVPHTQLTEVKLTRGPLPVRLTGTPGTGQPPTPPAEQPFWITTNATTVPTTVALSDTIEWTPSAVRGQQLALVVMNLDGTAPLRVELRAAVTAGWLPSTTWGVLGCGAVMLIVALVTLCWPERRREVVYVMEPAPAAPVAGTVIPRSAPPLAIEGPPPPIELDWPPRSPAQVSASGPPNQGATLTGGTVFPEGRMSR